MTIGERLKKLREVKPMTQQQLAQKCGMHDSAIRRYESGRQNPKKETIERIANALGVDRRIFENDTINDKDFMDFVNGDNAELFGELKTFDDRMRLFELVFCHNEVPNHDISMNINSTSEISASELNIIKKYRNLDDHGRKIIDYCLNEEYDRCVAAQTEQEEPEIISIKFAHLPASAGTGIDLSEENYSSLKVKANDLTKSADFAVKVSGDSMEPTYNDGDILLVEQLPINIGDIGIFILNGDGYVKEFGGDRLISHNKKYPDIKLSEHDVIMCPGRVIGALEEDDLDV
jgi:transcriptional regulator with XRE-family HTH domain